jgi:hypothetical protein
VASGVWVFGTQFGQSLRPRGGGSAFYLGNGEITEVTIEMFVCCTYYFKDFRSIVPLEYVSISYCSSQLEFELLRLWSQVYHGNVELLNFALA